MQKYELSQEDVHLVTTSFWMFAELFDDPENVPEVTGDAGDDLVLAVCVSGGCEYLATDDRVLLGLVEYGGTCIVTPRDLVTILA